MSVCVRVGVCVRAFVVLSIQNAKRKHRIHCHL
jgi:hypothetical protein